MAFDPVTAGLEAVAAGLNFAGGQSANKTAQQNLAFQRQNAADQLRLAKAGRTDAYGNRTSFDDVLNQWITELTPEQQRIIKGGEHEQLLGLTTDAAQNRDIRERQGRAAVQAGEDYNKTRAGFMFDQPRGEGATTDDLTGLILASRGIKGGVNQNAATPQNIRQSGNVPIINSGGNGASSGVGAPVAQALLEARRQAQGEHASREQAHQSEYLPVLQSLQQTMSAGGGAPIHFSDTPGNMMGQQEQMSKLIAEAMKNSGTANNNAATLAAKAGGAQFTDVAKYISQMGGNKGTTTPKVGDPGYFGGSPSGNDRLSPITYGNRNYTQDDFGDFTL